MANKKKRNPPRPPSGPRPGAKRPGQPPSAAKPGAGTAKAGTKPATGGDKAGAKPATGPAKAGAKPAGGGKAAGGSKPAGGAKAAAKPARERTGPTRSERLAAAEAARRRKATRTRALISFGLVAVLALLTVTIINSRRSNDRVVSRLEASGACNYDSRFDSDSGQNRNHVSGNVGYKVDPPSGGNHNASPAPAGLFTLENAPPDAQVVHSLEHGYIAIWYRPDLDAAALGELRNLANEYNRDVLLLPRASLGEVPVAATAWHRRLLCERADVESLERFITAYRNKGPEKVER